MTNQVSDMFPQFGRESIRNLIRTTGSSPVAIEAILRGALQNDQQILDITDSSQVVILGNRTFNDSFIIGFSQILVNLMSLLMIVCRMITMNSL